jgi:hypothetical protein
VKHSGLAAAHERKTATPNRGRYTFPSLEAAHWPVNESDHLMEVYGGIENHTLAKSKMDF